VVEPKNLSSMKIRYVLSVGIVFAAQFSALANSSFFVTPGFRGQAGSEYSGWESFTNAYNGPNYPSIVGSTSDAFITQTTPGTVPNGPFISSGNIYSFATTNTFTLTDSTAFTIGTVVLQLRNNDGSVQFDYNSVRLDYDNGGGLQSVFTPRVELNNTGGGVASLWNWDVSSLGINSYKIYFNASDVSLSLDAASLDVQAVPEPSGLALTGLGLLLLGKRAVRRRD
jgi:hypothetical protein